jgi:microcystin-dependent protein
MGIKISNNAVSRLAGNISDTATTINIVPGDGAKFPAISGSDWFPATLVNGTGDIEIVKCTARSSDSLTVIRGQEATAARTFNAGDRIDLRLTAAVFQTMTAEMMSALAEQGTQLAALLPAGTGPIPWSLPTEPAGWIFADGRTLFNDTAYPDLRTAYVNAGYPHGQDGSGNPKIPDARGRVIVGKDNMGGVAAGRLTTALGGIDGLTLGAAGGVQSYALSTAQLPYHAHTASAATGGAHTPSGSTDTEAAHTHTGSTGSAGAHSHTITTSPTDVGGSGSMGNLYSSGGGGFTTSTAAAHTHTVSVAAGGAHSHALTMAAVADHTHGVTVNAAGASAEHTIVQPGLVANAIVKT